MERQHPEERDEHSWLESVTCCTPGLRKPSGFGSFPHAGDGTTASFFSTWDKGCLHVPDEGGGVRLIFDQPASVDQPSFTPQPRPRPTTSHSVARVSTWLGNSRDKSIEFVRSRSSTITSTVRPWTSSGSRHRPKIGAPTDFRRVTNEPLSIQRRRSFRPLELSIYLPSGRLSPLPDFSTSDWEARLPQLPAPARALLRYSEPNRMEDNVRNLIPRKPVMSMPAPPTRPLSEPFDIAVENGPGPTLDTDVPPVPVLDNNRSPILDESQVLESRPSYVPSSTPSTPGRVRSPSPHTGRSRSQTESLVIPRKSSLRRSKEDTVEVAIRELNTIVEERRLSALIRARSGTTSGLQSTAHIPAVAPNMKLHARSETLNDIGSAFRIPMSAKSLPTPSVMDEKSAAFRRVWPGSGTLSEPLPLSMTSSATASTTALPTLPTPSLAPPMAPGSVLPQEPQRAALKSPSARSKISTWLRRSANPNTANSSPSISTPFYNLSSPLTTAPSRRRSGSTVSTMSTSTLTSMTADSQGAWSPPPNRRHSRTATIASTVATSILSPIETPDEPLPPRPSTSSVSKNGARRAKPKRGLSIETTASGKAFPPPPPYQRVDPLSPVSPVSGEVSPGTPRQVGVAF